MSWVARLVQRVANPVFYPTCELVEQRAAGDVFRRVVDHLQDRGRYEVDEQVKRGFREVSTDEARRPLSHRLRELEKPDPHIANRREIMTAYDRYARRLTLDEKNRSLREQAVVGRMGGADWVPETVAELDDYVERMRPKLAINEQTLAFLSFLLGRTDELRVGRFGQLDRWASLRGSMALMPDWARRLTGAASREHVARFVVLPSTSFRAKLVRWAYPDLPCKALALARVQGVTKTPDRGVVAPAHATAG